MPRVSPPPALRSRRIDVRLPAGWWERLQEIAQADGFMCPSELVREMIRARVGKIARKGSPQGDPSSAPPSTERPTT